MPNKRITLSDIAKEMNVSVGLVSLVLSGKAKENRIRDDVAQKVLAKAEEMGYQANIMARGLRTGKSGIIGLVVADIANPFFGTLARHIENEARKQGYQVMFGSSDEDPEKLDSIINTFHSRQVDGLIIVPVEESKNSLEKIKNQYIPTVLVDRECQDFQEDLICTDNYLGGFELTNVLIKEKYKKIGAFVYDLNLSNNIERIRGYKEAIQQADYEIEPWIYKVDYNDIEKELEKGLKKAIDEFCDAFFFANNNLGILSLKILWNIDKKLPKEIGMVSFDNPEAFEITRPRMTSYAQPIQEISKQAVAMLISKMENKQAPKIQRILLPGKLILRDSQ